jgi:hypothetical protein
VQSLRSPKILRKFGFVCILTFLPSSSAFADTFKWVDKNGVTGYADSLQKVPPEFRESAKRVGEGKTAAPSAGPFQVVPSLPKSGPTLPSVNPEEAYVTWQERIRDARSQLQELKAQRESAQKEYETLRAEFYVRSFADPEADAQYRAKLADLDEQINKKEYEVSVTIPDEARRAGVPPGMLAQ